MSNKTVLQSHNVKISNNNISIDDLIDSIRNLPDASGTIEPILQEKTITPTTSSQTITPDETYDGLSSVIVEAVTSSIDSNITSSNIKSGVSILGVEGTLEEGIIPIGEITITENGTYDVTEYASANVEIASDTSELEDIFITHSLSGDYSNDRVSVIGLGTFSNSGLTSVSFPNVTDVNNYAFYNNTKLTTMNMPNMNKCGDYSFYGISVSNLELLELTTGGNYAFQKMTECGYVNAPKLQSVSNGMFRDNTVLKKVDLGCATSIANMAFYWDKELDTFIIRTPDVICTLGGTAVFGSSKIHSKTGYIYVPKALVDQYASATNWSTYATIFRALEDYTVDGTITGELDETKI